MHVNGTFNPVHPKSVNFNNVSNLKAVPNVNVVQPMVNHPSQLFGIILSHSHSQGIPNKPQVGMIFDWIFWCLFPPWTSNQTSPKCFFCFFKIIQSTWFSGKSSNQQLFKRSSKHPIDVGLSRIPCLLRFPQRRNTVGEKPWTWWPRQSHTLWLCQNSYWKWPLKFREFFVNVYQRVSLLWLFMAPKDNHPYFDV